MKNFPLGFAAAVASLAIAIPGANAAILGYNWQGTFSVDGSQRNLSGTFEVDDAFQKMNGAFRADSLRSFTLNLNTLFPVLSSVTGSVGDLDLVSLVTDGDSATPGFNLKNEVLEFGWSGDVGAPQVFGVLFGEQSSKRIFGRNVNVGFFVGFLTEDGAGDGAVGAALPFIGDVGESFQVTNFTVASQGGAAAVPEPTTMIGLGLAGAGIAALKKRQVKKQDKVAVKH